MSTAWRYPERPQAVARSGARRARCRRRRRRSRRAGTALAYDRHSRALRSLCASSRSIRSIMAAGRAGTARPPARARHAAQQVVATTSAVGGSPVRTDISPKKSPGPSVQGRSPSTSMAACPSRMTKKPLPLRPFRRMRWPSAKTSSSTACGERLELGPAEIGEEREPGEVVGEVASVRHRGPP